MGKPVVSVVLASYNRKRLLKLTIDSIRTELENCDFPYEIIVVDGGSTDGTIGWLTKQKDIVSIIQHNRGKWRGRPVKRRNWGYFMNLGFKSAQGKYVCMLSDDCLVVPGAIRNGVAYFEERLSDGARLGAVPFYFILNYPEGTDYCVIRVGKHIYVNHGLYLHEAVRCVGYIDEEAYKFYAADADLCFKMISSGYCVEPCSGSKIIHFTHINRRLKESNYSSLYEDRKVLENRWSHMLDDSDDEKVEPLIKLQNEHFTRNDFYKRSINLYLTIILAKLESTRLMIRRHIMRILKKYLFKERAWL